GVVAHHPVHVAGPLALEYQLGAAQFVVMVVAIAGIAVEVGKVTVVPAAVGLDQAFETDFGTTDGVDRDTGMGEWRDAGQHERGRKTVWCDFHDGLVSQRGSGRRLGAKSCRNVTFLRRLVALRRGSACRRGRRYRLARGLVRVAADVADGAVRAVRHSRLADVAAVQ